MKEPRIYLCWEAALPTLQINRNYFIAILSLSILRQGISCITPYNNGPAFSSCFQIQITGTCLGAGSPVTVPRQSSLLTPQMNNVALSASQSPGPEMLWTVSLLRYWLSLLNQLIENTANNYQWQKNMKLIHRLSAGNTYYQCLFEFQKLPDEAKSVPQQHILPATPSGGLSLTDKLSNRTNTQTSPSLAQHLQRAV